MINLAKRKRLLVICMGELNRKFSASPCLCGEPLCSVSLPELTPIIQRRAKEDSPYSELIRQLIGSS